MELHQLRYFAAAARGEHFGRAAETLHVSQPSLSQGIARLESELGVRLFERRGRTVRLTEPGRRLLEAAEQVLAAESGMLEQAAAIRGLESGVLELVALPALDQHLLPAWLVRFRESHPQVQIRVREVRPSAAVAELVRTRQADLGFAQQPCPLDHLQHHPLLRDPIILVAPVHHPVGQAGAARLGELGGEEFVWVREAVDPEHPLMHCCLQAGFQPRIVCESGSAQGVLALVAAGLGIALLPRLAVEERPGIRIVTLLPAPPERELLVVWRPGGLTAPAKSFLEICQQD